MDTDFPCAHSMDTVWFAVDAAGHVAIFDSGENGSVPENARDVYDLLVETWMARHPGDEDSVDIEELAEELGLFVYDYDDSAVYEESSFEQIALYKRSSRPKVPLHLDQLPPTLRRQAKQSRFDKIDFARSECVQPLEQYPCVFWAEDPVAYLCSDGKTVRPIPGVEEKFAEFCVQFQKANPEEARKLIFEAPRERPKKRRRRKEKDSGE